MAVERRYEMLYGGGLQQRIRERPLAWVPLGILEKHGEHLPWGLDGLKAHGVCLFLAQRIGGVVLPAIHVAGVHEPWVQDPRKERQLQAQVGDFYIRAATFRMLLEDIIRGLSNIGFKAIVLYSGHYPVLQEQLLCEIAETASKEQGVAVIGFTEHLLFDDGDHSGKWETSLYMALGGEVRLDRADERQVGQWGYWHDNNSSPMLASREFGEEKLNVMLEHFRAFIGKALPNET